MKIATSKQNMVTKWLATLAMNISNIELFLEHFPCSYSVTKDTFENITNDKELGMGQNKTELFDGT